MLEEYSCNEVCGGDGPAFRQLFGLDLRLFGQHLIADFLSIATLIRSSSQHAFVGDDSYGEIVSGHAMIASTHNLRRYHPTLSYYNFSTHVSWRSTRVLSVIRIPYSCYAEIRNMQVSYRLN